MEIWIRLQQFSSDLHVQKNCSQTSFTNISYSQSASISIFVKTDLTLLVSVGLLAYSNFFCQNKMLACRVDEQLKNSVSCRWTPHCMIPEYSQISSTSNPALCTTSEPPPLNLPIGDFLEKYLSFLARSSLQLFLIYSPDCSFYMMENIL